MAAVIGMGVLIVLGVGVIAVTIARRVAGTVSPSAAATVMLDEPTGTRIAGLVPDGPDRLALRLEGGGPDRVVIIDLRSGRTAGRVGLAR